jgi:hypothetical protein
VKEGSEGSEGRMEVIDGRTDIKKGRKSKKGRISWKERTEEYQGRKEGGNIGGRRAEEKRKEERKERT